MTVTWLAETKLPVQFNGGYCTVLYCTAYCVPALPDHAPLTPTGDKNEAPYRVGKGEARRGLKKVRGFGRRHAPKQLRRRCLYLAKYDSHDMTVSTPVAYDCVVPGSAVVLDSLSLFFAASSMR